MQFCFNKTHWLLVGDVFYVFLPPKGCPPPAGRVVLSKTPFTRLLEHFASRSLWRRRREVCVCAAQKKRFVDQFRERWNGNRTPKRPIALPPPPPPPGELRVVLCESPSLAWDFLSPCLALFHLPFFCARPNLNENSTRSSATKCATTSRGGRVGDKIE